MSLSMKTVTAYVEIRSQKSVGDAPGKFGGPDTCFSVQVVPDGAKRLLALNRRAAKMRGIELIDCGEGYSRNRGKRSAYGTSLAFAEATAAAINQAGREWMLNPALAFLTGQTKTPVTCNEDGQRVS